MLRKLLSTVLFMAFFVPAVALAQTGSIEGTVTDAETGDTIPGANVFLVEVNRGAATDADGHYEIDNVEPGTYTLRVTFVGYSTYTEQVTIDAGETLQNDIQLQMGAVGLDEVVVTGYGQEVGAVSLTSSIASVNTAELEDVPIATAGELLQGRAAGVRVQATSGQPGAGFTVSVRGAGSINADSRPLYIVNGVQISFSADEGVLDTNPLNFLDPDNIASFQILKDAAATAIYGASGANGVVLITTKSGFQGPTLIKASVSRGYTQAANPIELMNTDQWFEYFSRATGYFFDADPTSQVVQDYVLSNYVIPIGGFNAGITPEELPYTNWVDYINRTGINQEYSLSFSGGNEETTFYIMGSLGETTGKIKNTDFDRYSLTTSFDHTASEEFSLGLDLTLASTKQRGTCEDGFFVNCPVSAVIFEMPFAVPYDTTGEYSLGTRFPGLNIAALLNERERTSDVFSLLGNLSATYDFTPALSLRSQVGMDYSNNRSRTYRSPFMEPAAGGTLFSSVQYGVNLTASSVLSYRHSFDGKHNISGLLGAEYRRDYFRYLATSTQGFPGSLFTVISTGAEPQTASGFTEEFRKLGFFGSAKYNYDQRYYLGATLRYDGSSKFGTDNSFGFFPAVSAAWRISEEDFFTSSLINELKLRASFGIAGNSLIDNYAARGLYSVGRNYGGVSGVYPNQLANPLLTWEESVQYNLGLDFAMFNDRLSGSINVYQKNNQALLLEQPLPGTTGYDNIFKNIGEVRNRGIEFIFNSVNIRAGDFMWSSNFNISYGTNEILSLSEGIEELEPGNLLPFAVGHSLQAIKRVRWAGVNPADGRPMWYDGEGNITYTPNFTDDAVFGNTGESEVIGGFGNTFNYKGLSLNVFFQYSFGGYAVPQTAFFFGTAQITSTVTNGRVAALTESWREPGDITPFPAPTLGTTYPGTFGWSRTSSNAFYSTDYIRLKNVSLSYSLPSSITESINLRNLTVYVSAYNLATFTNYPGYDPEVPEIFPASSYPIGRRISAGIEVAF